MNAAEVLNRLTELGITARTAGGKLLLQPGSKVPADLLDEVRENKPEILAHLRRELQSVGDGQPPPLDRPPQNEQELRRLIDYLAQPELFDAWFDWAMSHMDPAELGVIENGSHQSRATD